MANAWRKSPANSHINYSRAREQNKAIHYLRLAGERALARGAPIEAEDHYRRALVTLSELPQTAERDRLELTLCMGLGVVLRASRSFSHPDRRLAYERAQELAEKLGETSQLMEALLGLAVSAAGNGQIKVARQLGERMVTAAERSGDGAALCAAHAFLGQNLMWQAEHEAAQEHLKLGNIAYDELHPHWLASWGIDALAVTAIVALLRGFPDQARQLFEQALRRSKSRNERYRLGAVRMWGAILFELLHDETATLEQAQVLGELAAREPMWGGLANLYTGIASIMRGKWEEGEESLRHAINFCSNAGLRIFLNWAKLYEAELLTAQRQIDHALSRANDLLADTEEFLHLRSRVLRLRANLLAHERAEESTIETAHRKAIECARAQDARYFELLATTSFAQWLKSQNRGSEARTMLTDIYNWFTEGFDIFALRQARKLLDELAQD
jgi:adenylate cyclase